MPAIQTCFFRAVTCFYRRGSWFRDGCSPVLQHFSWTLFTCKSFSAKGCPM